MCMDHAVICKCGKKSASFNLKNEIMPPEIIETLYCPDCSRDLQINNAAMLKDNGWVIHYDMDVAGLYDNKLPADDRDNLSPEVLFDKGYATWRGIYPGDHLDSVREREDLVKLSKENPKKYFEEVRNWANNRMARLQREGWRKAYEG